MRSDIPEEFMDPITREVMKNPVIAEDGFSYEFESIKNWLQTCKDQHRPFTSPMTNEEIGDHFIPNITLRNLINSSTKNDLSESQPKVSGSNQDETLDNATAMRLLPEAHYNTKNKQKEEITEKQANMILRTAKKDLKDYDREFDFFIFNFQWVFKYTLPCIKLREIKTETIDGLETAIDKKDIVRILFLYKNAVETFKKEVTDVESRLDDKFWRLFSSTYYDAFKSYTDGFETESDYNSISQ